MKLLMIIEGGKESSKERTRDNPHKRLMPFRTNFGVKFEPKGRWPVGQNG